ncbi:Integrase [Methylobacterium sp. yr668]|nr:Integrase [Methylobacterium sp. yr668]
MRLTNQTAAAAQLPAGKDRLVVFDDDLPGFGLRVSAGGSRQWIVQYRNAIGQTKRETLGRVGLLSATDARRAASERLARAKLGEDPHAEKQLAKARALVTLGSKVNPYLEAAASRLRDSSLRDATRYMRVAWKPLHREPLHAVTRAKVAERLAEISKDSGPYAANRARATLSAFFAWLIGTGAAETNPVMGTIKTAQEEKRRRVLTPDEIKSVLKACRDDDFGSIVRLLLLTGQRREEVAGLTWAELDLVGGIWHLPGERTKNSLPHDVPLSRPALDILAKVQPISGRAYLFGDGAGAFSGFSKAKAALDKRSGVTDWRLHDLRRTVSTGMNERGVLPHVVEAVLNHISGSRAGVAGVYNHALYNPEKRAALDLWANYLAATETSAD